MKTSKRCTILTLACLIPAFGMQAQSRPDILEKLEEVAVVDQKVMMPMRDGIRLCTDIYRPKTDKPVPIIFSRTPYNFNSWGDGELKTRTMERAYDLVKEGTRTWSRTNAGGISPKANGISWACR